MIYVFDSCAFIHLFTYYYPDRFPSLWESFDALVSEHRIISVREVKNELEEHSGRLSDWVRDHYKLFLVPEGSEFEFVTSIFRISHFQALIRQQERLQGKPVADPFVVAKARKLEEGCVVTQESNKPNGARIPNVCEHFDIPCMNLEKFMENEKWRF